MGGYLSIINRLGTEGSLDILNSYEWMLLLLLLLQQQLQLQLQIFLDLKLKKAANCIIMYVINKTYTEVV